MEPINRWLAQLKIAHKLILSSIVFALPIAILLAYLTAQYNQEIHTCQREVTGSRMLEVCPGLLRDLRELESRARLATGSAMNPTDGGAEIRKRIVEALATLRDNSGAGSQELSERLAGLVEQVEADKFTRTPAEEDAGDRRMIEEVSESIPLILDDFSLTLDSELDTYYLMNLTGPLLLQAQAALAEARGIALGAQARGRRLEALDFLQLQADCRSLSKATFPRLRYSLEKARAEAKRLHGADSAFEKSVPPLFERYVERATQLEAAVNRPSEQAGGATEAGGFGALATAAEDAGVNLGQTGAQELRALLYERIGASRRAQWAALLMSFLCTGLAAGVMVIVTRNITRPLERVVKMTTEIAAGRVKEAFERLQEGELREFTAGGGHGRARTRDEIWNLIRSVGTMTESLNALLVKVTKACAQVTGSATQAAAAVREVEATVSEQAASTNQVSATSKEIHATAQDLARTMEAVMKVASGAVQTARAGVGRLEGMRTAMQGLLDSSAAMTRSFETINQKTGNIDKVISTITKIANRTNLLSLNAAIEAEKAGRQAGGFSVVALEMRRLADQTAVAALDIERQIREMQQAIRGGVASVEAFARQTQDSSAAVSELSAGLGQVIEGTTQLGPQFETVNSGMQMQSEGAGQIAAAMLNLGAAADQTKATMAEFREVTVNLHDAVHELQAEVGRFSTAT